MAYLFGAGGSDQVACGAVNTGATWSMFLRFKLTSSNATVRRLMMVNNLAGTLFQMYLQTPVDGDNWLELGFSDGGGANFNLVQWNSGFAAGDLHTVVGTYDGSNLRLYADTDATAKATAANSGTPDSTDVLLCLGNITSGSSSSADATLYEAAWAPGIVWTGAQAAALGGGNARGLTLPLHYWPLIDSASDLFGEAAGTATGASIVAHAGTNLYTVVASQNVGGGRLVNGGLVG